jgi:hypothetical protein
MVSRTEVVESNEVRQLEEKATKALILNVMFFLVLVFASFSLPFVRFFYAAIIISWVFVITVFYIYYT